jgi:hypothetical protein
VSIQKVRYAEIAPNSRFRYFRYSFFDCSTLVVSVLFGPRDIYWGAAFSIVAHPAMEAAPAAAEQAGLLMPQLPKSHLFFAVPGLQ